MRLKLYAVAVVALLVTGVVACGKTPTTPTPVIINITNTNTNNNGPGTPSPSPSPGAGAGGAHEFTKVSQFGENCPAGSGPATWVQGGPPVVHVGCTAPITCSPKDKDGKDASGIPPAPDLFVATGGSDLVEVKSAGPGLDYNLDVKGKTPGSVTFICIVAGKKSDAWTLPVVP